MGSSSRKLWVKKPPPEPKPIRGPPLGSQAKVIRPDPILTPAVEQLPPVLIPVSVQIDGEIHLPQPRINATIHIQSYRKWPNLIVATSEKVYIMKDGKITHTILDNPDNDDKGYLGISWSNADLFVSSKVAIYKFYQTLDNKYRRVTPLVANKIHCVGATIFASTAEGVSEYTVGLDLDRRKTKKTPPEEAIERGPKCFVGKKDSKVLLFDENMDNVDEIELPDAVHEVRVIDSGHCHNNTDFPIQELL